MRTILAGLFLLISTTARAQITNVSVSPSSGNAASGVIQAFTATYNDPAGWTDIYDSMLQVSTGTTGISSCYVLGIWNAGAPGIVFLITDNGASFLGPINMGSMNTLQNSQCTVYGAGSSFSGSGTQLTMTVNVSFTAAYAANQYTFIQATGGISSSWQQMGTWTVNGPGTQSLAIATSHSSSFTPGQSGAYTLTVTNAGSAATTGTVTVTDFLPSVLTATAISGPGWTCTAPGGPCTRSDPLAAGSSYPPIALTVNVASNASGTVTNQANVSGGGSTGGSATDPTVIGGCGTLSTITSPANGATLGGSTVTFTWCAAPGNPPYYLWVFVESCG